MPTETEQIPKCNECGAVATHVVQDYLQWYEGFYIISHPYIPPRIRAGCGDHPVEPHVQHCGHDEFPLLRSM